ncbi:tyrosine phosphatase family protein [Candidatus Viadribacter manganicus]|uniref:tyrosine phosphatase family protein n=1 Tax=Candidatus Viadribacter manganicus TaxID=1759059 RepID=UPI000834111D|nr:protein-tyrosine phosphatase family protein [Candidatus Viadribacter manganicus]
MTIIVCPLSRAPEITKQRAPSRAVSLLDRDTAFPVLGLGDHHLQLDVHDIEVEADGLDACCDTRMGRILEFVRGWDRNAPILIHCWAGISRSTATAYITACVHNPHADEHAIARALREASPTATPNRRFIALADAALQRNGRMNAAIEAIGRGYPRWPDIKEAEPFQLTSQFAA